MTNMFVQNNIELNDVQAAFGVGKVQKLPRTREHLYKSKIRLYPATGLQKATYCNMKMFRNPDEEFNIGTDREDYDRAAMGENVSDDSLRRAKERVFDYAMLNGFDYFFTWTLNKELIDRYDRKVVSEKIQNFLSNKVQRNNMRYIVVPEFHKDGAIHAHGLCSGDFNLVDSGKRDRAKRRIYNVLDWKWGFSTVIRLDGSYEKACYYITKYIQKKGKMVFGNFYYAGGHGLIRQPETLYFNGKFEDVEAPEVSVKGVAVGFKYQDYREGKEE
jgi:hypothetical protein